MTEKVPESSPVLKQWTPRLVQRLLSADQARIQGHIHDLIRWEAGDDSSEREKGTSPFQLEQNLAIEGGLDIDRAMRLDLQKMDLEPLCSGSVLVAGFPHGYSRHNRRTGETIYRPGTTHKQYLRYRLQINMKNCCGIFSSGKVEME